MKIVHVVHHFPPESIAGCETYVRLLAEAQAGLQHAVWVLTRSLAPASCPVPDKEGDAVSVHRVYDDSRYIQDWRKMYNVAVQMALERLLAAVQPDVVHIHHWMALSLNLARTCRRLGVPSIVITLHDLFVTCPTGHRMHIDGYLCEAPASIDNCHRCLLEGGQDPLRTSDELAVLGAQLDCRQEALADELAQADGIVLGTRSFADFVSRFAPLDEVRTHIIPLPVRRSASSRPPVDHGRFRIGHFGSLNHYKGPHLLCEAVALLPLELRERVSVLLVGRIYDDEYRAQLLGFQNQLDLVITDQVYKPDELASHDFDICVFPSLHFESFSFVVNEAIQLQIPVIVPDMGAPASSVGECGLLFHHGDKEDLAARIRQLLESDSLRERCRRACGRARLEQMDMGSHLTALQAVYEKSA